ncbi:MAG TPA: nucleoside-diphosphate kinase [Candidatus Marinimicrobia bacterium]|nr:nucleoside-diphosphate kinase [Candidatus Neomarinimicrobiota bacterium]HIM26660.1 nucleoside-diphosphate kinase [Candidatus Neomarinimicrobiota bacterium]
MGNQTLAIIKPDAVQNQYTELIYESIVKAGFIILASKMIHMTKAETESFYAIHQGKPFYEELTSFMSSGQCMVLALEKENAVDTWREIIGATNPAEAAVGTIRKDFATSLGKNAVHGSDSDENAEKEIAFFFSQSELRANK